MLAADRSPSLTLRGISKRYGAVTVLHELDLDVAAGEFITLLGPSGSGKTTLLMILAGFVRPQTGSITVAGEEIVGLAPNRRNIGMVFQNYALFPHMDVFHNVAFPLRQRGVPRRELGERVREVLDLVQLGGFGERRIDQLSGGQKQRVALARAIVFEPRILLMDEPLSALDKKLREHMQIEIRELHRRLGMTTVYVTHDQREAITMSDRIAVMNEGRIVQIDTPQQLYTGPRTRFVAEFIGESTLVPVSVTGGVARFCDRPLRTITSQAGAEGRRWLVVRPERLLVVDGAGAQGELNLFDGVVKDLVYQGESIVCYVVLEDGSHLAVRSYVRGSSGTDLPALGERIRLGLGPADTILVSDDA